jgi:small subunit ribosomal protein S17
MASTSPVSPDFWRGPSQVIPGLPCLVPQYFADPKTYMVHDPNSSLRTGDVVAITPGWRTSQHKRHVVKHIIVPASVPLASRPPVPTEEERTEMRDAKKAAKDERRRARKESEAAAREQSSLAAKALKQKGRLAQSGWTEAPR